MQAREAEMYYIKEESSLSDEPILIDGQRANTNIVVYDGYAYHTNYTTDSTRYLQCASYGPLRCPARACIPIDGEMVPFSLKKPHNHGPDPHLIERNNFIQELKRRVVQRAGTIKSIYDQACLEFPNVSALVAFQTIESSLRRARATTHPREPMGLIEFAEIIMQPEWRRFAQTVNGRPFYSNTVEGSDGSIAVMFLNPDFIEKVSVSTELFLDASFILDPIIVEANYLFSAHVTLHGHSHAIMYAMLTSRTTSMFMAVLSHLRQSAPNLHPTYVICDYEQSLYMSAKESFPKSKIQGTFFHYTMHVYNKLNAIGIINAAEENAELKNIVRMILGLALLPSEKVPIGINTVEKLTEPVLPSAARKELFDYLDEQWWKGITPDLFSVYNEPYRTNNNIEMFHRTFRQRMTGVSNIWIFTEKLKEIECLTFRDCELLQGGHAITRERKTKLLTHDDKLTRAWRMIETKRLPEFSFLQRAVEILKNIETQLACYKEYYEKVDLISGEEVLGKTIKVKNRRSFTSNYEEEMKRFRNAVKRKAPSTSQASKTTAKEAAQAKTAKKNLPSNVCIICEDEDWEARCELLPCGHRPLCTVCATRITTDKTKCPICKENVRKFVEKDCSF